MFKKYYLLSILLIAFVLRFYLLGSIPVGFSNDEASLGYNAYSILKTGKDEHGTSFPLAFKAFGEYKAPLYIYLTVPMVSLFNLNEEAVRLPSAIFGFLTVILLYALTKKLFNNQNIAFCAAFALATLPWHLQFTRIAYEGSLVVFLLTSATFCFIKGFDDKKFLIISFVLFTLTFYSHYAVRLFIPLFILLLQIIYRNKLLLVKKTFIISIFSALLILIPLVPFLFSKAGLSRAGYISFTTDKGILFSINEKRAEHLWSNYKISLPAIVLHNKLIDYSKKFIENYLAHFDPSFLFVKGDEDKLFQTPYSGLIPISFLPLLFAGLIKLIKEKGVPRLVVLGWLFLAPIPSSLTRLPASSNRAFIMVIPISIIIGLGFITLLNLFNKKYKLILIFWLLIISFEYLLYLDSYYIHLAIKNEGDRRFSSKEAIKYVSKIASTYEKIWVSTRSNGYIHYLFYLKYPPEVYQKQAKLSQLDEYGFGNVLGFDKYSFDRIPKYFDFQKNILYVAGFGEEPKGLIPLKTVYHPDKQPYLVIFDTQAIKTSCPPCDLLLKPQDIDFYGDMINLK